MVAVSVLISGVVPAVLRLGVDNNVVVAGVFPPGLQKADGHKNRTR